MERYKPLLIASALSAVLVIQGCSTVSVNESSETQEPEQIEPDIAPAEAEPVESEKTYENLWLKACDGYNFTTDQAWGIAYEVLIDDICQNTVIDENSIDIVLGPSVSNEDMDRSMDANVFAHSYWKNFLPEDVEPVTIIIASEKDREWWEATVPEYTTVDFQWFSETGRCWEVSARSACGEKHGIEGSLTGAMVESYMIGTEAHLNGSTWWNDPSHNAPHWYHDVYEYEHWYELLIEGHATLYEIASYQLYENDDWLRMDFAWLARTVDEIKMDALTPEGVMQHLEKCYGIGGSCNHFYYGGGAMMHEKLIIDFGLESYFAWHEKVRMIETSKDAGFIEFKQVFANHYEVEFEQWMSESFAPYVADSYVHYSEVFKSNGDL